jgi:putative peptidoglycan lipid II flippase
VRFDWRHEAVRHLVRLAAWVALYVAANQLAYVVIIVLNNRFEAGPQIYTTAFTVFQLPHAIFAVSIFTALLPGMSERWSTGHPEGVRVLVSRGLRDTAVVTIPAAVGLLVMAEPISRLLFEHGQAVARDSVAIARTLQGFAAGLLFFSTFQLLTRTFYAMQDTRTPALVNVGTATVNVVAAFVYVVGPLKLGLRGMALAHATSYAKTSVAALISAAAALGVIDAWDVPVGAGVLTLAAQVGVAIIVGVLVFLVSALILRVGEVDDLRKVVVRRFRG